MVMEQIQRKKDIAKKHYDTRAGSEQPPLRIGDYAYAKTSTNPTWQAMDTQDSVRKSNPKIIYPANTPWHSEMQPAKELP